MVYKILGLVVFFFAGLGVAANGLVGIKTGKTMGWGEEEFIRRVYRSDQSPVIFWTLVSGKVAVGVTFSWMSAVGLVFVGRDKKIKDIME